MATPNQETLWVLRASAGDREALDALLKSVQAPLFGYILSLVGRRDIAEDVLQEVLLRIFKKLRWLSEPRAFRAWAYRIATRESLRRLSVKEPEQAIDFDALAGDDASGRAVSEKVEALLAAISPASRPVVALHYLHEFTIEEVADVLGIPCGTAKSRLAYGLAQLRRQQPDPMR